jgi:hypothetical protein
MTREQRIEAFRAKMATSPALPLLSEGAGYMMEFCASETVLPVVLLKIIDDTPLGRGFSFQLPTKRVFVYEHDILPGPDGSLIVMGSSS